MSSTSVASASPLQPTRPSGSKQQQQPSSPTSPRAAAAATATAASDGGGAAKTTPELERKRKLVQSIQILSLAVKEQHCSEDDLVQALTLATFADGEYIFCQGQTERDVYFIEDGRVLITQRRAGTGAARVSARRRSAEEAELEIQIMVFDVLEYFGELALLQNANRKLNAVASGATSCMVLSESAFHALLAPLHELMLYRHLLRAHSVLEKHRLFKDFTLAQRLSIISHCTLATFADRDVICRQSERDDRYFILADGEAHVVLDESVGSSNIESTTTTTNIVVQSTTVAHKSLFQGFGEMGLLDRPRTANVIARGTRVVCAVIQRCDYIRASQLLGSGHLDADAESLLATTLVEEWNLVVNARNLHLSNPHVAHYLVTFIKQFKAAYNLKFVGKTMYLDLLRRLHLEPQLRDEVAFVAARVAYDAPASSLSIVRSETRRILGADPTDRTPAEMSFIGRLLEPSAFIDKFERPLRADRHKVARHIGRVAGFVHMATGTRLFRQGKIESRAFVILRGRIDIVNEDIGNVQQSRTLQHYEVIATLGAGASFGELSLVTRLPRSATAVVASDADLVMLDREQLVLLKEALPGVDMRHEMVERATFLAQLDFFYGCDFGQCIRVAHDMQAVTYEPRFVFLREPAHFRTLYIVESGEIAVFVRKTVPATVLQRGVRDGCTPVTPAAPLASVMTTTNVGTTLSTVSSPSTTATSASVPTKTVLVRVATIGPQEFFGVAIAFAVTASASASPSSTGGVGSTAATASTTTNTNAGASSGASTAAPTLQHSIYTATTQTELASTVFMCCTRVQVLELSERGWRRLAPSSLERIRSALLERNRWHHALVDAPAGAREPSYYDVERPWHVLVRANPMTGEAEERPSTQLARDVRAKQQSPASTSALFRVSSSAESKRRTSASVTPIDRAVRTPRADTGIRTAATTAAAYSPRRDRLGTSQTPVMLSPRSSAFVIDGLSSPRSSSNTNSVFTSSPSASPRQSSRTSTDLGGSFISGSSAASHSHALSLSPRAVSPRCTTSSLTHKHYLQAAPSSTDFVRVLAPILPLSPVAGAASSSSSRGSSNRTVRSSPGRVDSSRNAKAAIEAMWKLPRRPSIE